MEESNINILEEAKKKKVAGLISSVKRKLMDKAKEAREKAPETIASGLTSTVSSGLRKLIKNMIDRRI